MAVAKPKTATKVKKRILTPRRKRAMSESLVLAHSAVRQRAEQRAAACLKIYLELGTKRSIRACAEEAKVQGIGVKESSIFGYSRKGRWSTLSKEYDDKHRAEYERDVMMADKLTDLLNKAREGDAEAGIEAKALLSGSDLVDEMRGLRDLMLGTLKATTLRPRTVTEVATLMNSMLGLQKMIELLSGNVTDRKESIKIDGAAAKHLAAVESRLRSAHIIDVTPEPIVEPSVPAIEFKETEVVNVELIQGCGSGDEAMSEIAQDAKIDDLAADESLPTVAEIVERVSRYGNFSASNVAVPGTEH